MDARSASERVERIFTAAAAALATAAAVHGGQPVLHVDDDAPAGGDGLSWSTALNDLQRALGMVGGQPGPAVIKIASGTYVPNCTSPLSAVPCMATFALSGVSLVGGFAGIGSPDPDLRDTQRFATVLSGDLAGDDGSMGGSRIDNARHVVTVASGTTAWMDGITVRGGQAETGLGTGAGASVRDAATLTVHDCRFIDNYASENGGAIGGAGRVYLTGTVFSSNRAGGSGGALAAESPAVSACRFVGNEAGLNGGAVAVPHSTDLAAFAGCTFERNIAGRDGGAVSSDFSRLVVDNCMLIDNRAVAGGALAIERGRVELRDSLVRGNLAERSGGALQARGTVVAEIMRTEFTDNRARGEGTVSGGAVDVGTTDTADVRVVNCRFLGNTTESTSLPGPGSSGLGAAISHRGTLRSTFIVNRLELAGCEFSGNRIVAHVGDGAAIASLADLTATNCTFSGNRAPTGDSRGATVILGGGTRIGRLINGILWDHASDGSAVPPIRCDGGPCGPQVFLSRCLIEDWDQSVASEFTSGADPRLSLPAGRDGIAGTPDDDLSLLPGSPAIDAAAAASLAPDWFDLDHDGDTTDPLPFDVAGRARVVDDAATLNVAGALDLGAREYICSADYDESGSATPDDLYLFLSDYFRGSGRADLSGDGFIGVQDVFDFLTAMFRGC